jgi:hypothetical protein
VISYHAALIDSVVLVASTDGDLADPELATIREMVVGLPMLKDFETGNFLGIAGPCTDLLTEKDGFDGAIAVDGDATQEELRFFVMLRHEIEVERLTAAAIERGSVARYARRVEKRA